jgi:hypothetical protein
LTRAKAGADGETLEADNQPTEAEVFRFTRSEQAITAAIGPWRELHLRSMGFASAAAILMVLGVATVATVVIGVSISAGELATSTALGGIIAIILMAPVVWLFSLDVRRKANADIMRMGGLGDLPLMMAGEGVISFQSAGLWYCDSRSAFMVSWAAGASIRVEGDMTWIMMGSHRMMGIPTEGMLIGDGVRAAVARQETYPQGISLSKRDYLLGNSLACKGCKQDLRGTQGERCPECGREVLIADLPVGWWEKVIAVRRA